MRSHAAAEVEAPQLSGRFAPSFTPLVVLQACHIAELTGTMTARRGARLVSVSFEGGEIAAADGLECEGFDALMELGSWTDGRFEFMGGAIAPSSRLPGPFQWLMLELCRRLDEAAVLSSAGSSP